MIELTPLWFWIMFTYSVFGAFVVGSWIAKIVIKSIEFVQAKKQLTALENKIKLAELRAREIQAGL